MSKAGKIKPAGGQSASHRVSMHFRHICRSADIDDETGLPKQHSFRNKDIDPTRTHMNEVWVNDFEGNFKSVESLGEVMGVWDRYMDQLDPDVTIRKDAVYMRGAVLNLDEDWWEQNNPDWKTEGLNEAGRRMMDALLDTFIDEVGQKNVAVASLHMDEHIPQWQVDVVPIVDGRLASDKVLPSGSKEMTQFHQRMRQRMTTAGYDIEMTSSGRSKERLSNATIKKALRWVDEQEAATGVRPELPTPSNLLEQAILAAMSSPHVFDEESFDQQLAEYDVTREVDPETQGTVFSMPNPFYDEEDEEDRHHSKRVYRKASTLPSKPTTEVVAHALAKKREIQHGQSKRQPQHSSTTTFSTVKHVDVGRIDDSVSTIDETARRLDATAEQVDGTTERTDAAAEHADKAAEHISKLDQLTNTIDETDARRRTERDSQQAKRSADDARRVRQRERNVSIAQRAESYSKPAPSTGDDEPSR